MDSSNGDDSGDDEEDLAGLLGQATAITDQAISQGNFEVTPSKDAPAMDSNSPKPKKQHAEAIEEAKDHDVPIIAQGETDSSPIKSPEEEPQTEDDAADAAVAAVLLQARMLVNSLGDVPKKPSPPKSQAKPARPVEKIHTVAMRTHDVVPSKVAYVTALHRLRGTSHTSGTRIRDIRPAEATVDHLASLVHQGRQNQGDSAVAALHPAIETLAKPKPRKCPLKYATFNDARECRFRHKKARSHIAAIENPACGYDFVKSGDSQNAKDIIARMEAAEINRRQRLEATRGEEEYNARQAKKECPKCGMVQSYAEFRDKKKRCTFCGVLFVLPKVWGDVGNSFLERMEQWTLNHEANQVKIRQAVNLIEQTQGKVTKSARQKILERRLAHRSVDPVAYIEDYIRKKKTNKIPSTQKLIYVPTSIRDKLQSVKVQDMADTADNFDGNNLTTAIPLVVDQLQRDGSSTTEQTQPTRDSDKTAASPFVVQELFQAELSRSRNDINAVQGFDRRDSKELTSATQPAFEVQTLVALENQGPGETQAQLSESDKILKGLGEPDTPDDATEAIIIKRPAFDVQELSSPVEQVASDMPLDSLLIHRPAFEVQAISDAQNILEVADGINQSNEDSKVTKHLLKGESSSNSLDSIPSNRPAFEVQEVLSSATGQEENGEMLEDYEMDTQEDDYLPDMMDNDSLPDEDDITAIVAQATNITGQANTTVGPTSTKLSVLSGGQADKKVANEVMDLATGTLASSSSTNLERRRRHLDDNIQTISSRKPRGNVKVAHHVATKKQVKQSEPTRRDECEPHAVVGRLAKHKRREPRHAHANLDDAKHCRFYPKKTKASIAAMLNPACGYDFVNKADDDEASNGKGFLERMEAAEFNRRKRLETTRGEEDYNLRQNKKQCPKCGMIQSYAEFRDKKKRCTFCGVLFALPKAWGDISSTFLERMEQLALERERNRRELAARVIEYERSIGKVKKSSMQKRLEKCHRIVKSSAAATEAAFTVHHFEDPSF
ncbi:hypothetical protein AeRB84_021227 [Aphanomyces euteiches]|nr:hypothetical protein AeRB84_021227 [Aphanomyces euteiches]